MKLLTTLTVLMFAAGSVSQIRADEDSPLAKAMTTTNDAMKALGKETDSTKGAAMAREAQEGIVKSIPLVPELIADMPDAAARAKALADWALSLVPSHVAQVGGALGATAWLGLS